MPRLSVIVPNYNREKLVGETLANLLSQTRPPDELIVVDDGSTDGSADVIAGFGKAVTLLRQENSGPAVARNRGFARSSGEFIQFFDSDDLCSLNKLEAQERALALGDAAFAYGPWLQARLEENFARHSGPVIQQRGLPAARPPLAWYLRGWVTVFQCCLFRRDLLERVGPYRTDLMPTEDSELLFRILLSGARPVHVAEALVLYRLHGNYQISQGGMAQEVRAGDWLRFTGIVEGQLRDATGVSGSDLRHWRWVHWDAVRAAKSLGIDAAPTVEPPGLIANGHRAAARLMDRVTRRLRGSAWPPSYQAGAITPDQRRLLAELGYEAVADDDGSDRRIASVL